VWRKVARAENFAFHPQIGVTREIKSEYIGLHLSYRVGGRVVIGNLHVENIQLCVYWLSNIGWYLKRLF